MQVVLHFQVSESKLKTHAQTRRKIYGLSSGDKICLLYIKNDKSDWDNTLQCYQNYILGRIFLFYH